MRKDFFSLLVTQAAQKKKIQVKPVTSPNVSGLVIGQTSDVRTWISYSEPPVSLLKTAFLKIILLHQKGNNSPIRSNPESDPNRSPSRSKRSDPGFVDGQCHALLFHNASHCNTHFRVNMSVLTPAKGVHDCLLGRHRGSSLFSSLSFNHSSFITSFTMEE